MLSFILIFKTWFLLSNITGKSVLDKADQIHSWKAKFFGCNTLTAADLGFFKVLGFLWSFRLILILFARKCMAALIKD